MNNLWAPWRIKYLIQHKDKKCVFCKAYRDKRDRKNFIIYRSNYCFVIINIFPYNNGHVMIVINRHIKSLEKLFDKELLDIALTTKRITKLIKTVLHPEGFNIGFNIGKTSGAGISSHLHLHIVPRWQGDTNFMPVISNTKIVSQSIIELYTELRKCLQEK